MVTHWRDYNLTGGKKHFVFLPDSSTKNPNAALLPHLKLFPYCLSVSLKVQYTPMRYGNIRKSFTFIFVKNIKQNMTHTD